MDQDASMMDFWGELILGLIQGITEIIPVSSSGHIALASKVLGDVSDFEPVSFKVAIFLHFGTFLVILWFFQKDVLSLGHSSLISVSKLIGKPFPLMQEMPTPYLGEATPFFLLISFVPTGLLAFSLRTTAAQWFENPLIVGILLSLNGLIIYLTGNFSSGNRKIRDLHMWEFMLLGLAQGLAVLPGISRFGLVLCTGLWRKLDWFEALKLSFLFSLPTILIAVLFELVTNHSEEIIISARWVNVGSGILIAVIGGYISIKILLKQGLNSRKRLNHFGIYCITLGLFFAVYVAFLG